MNALLEDHLGQIWAATDDDVFVRRGTGQSAFERVDLGFDDHTQRHQVWDLVEDSAGTVWIASSRGLTRYFHDGHVVKYRAHPTRAHAAVWALALDETGRIWAGLDDGVVVFVPPAVEEPRGRHPWQTLVRETVAGTPFQSRFAPSGALAHVASPRSAAARWYTFPGRGDRNWIRALHRGTDGRIWVGTSSGSVYSFDGRGHRTLPTAHRLTADKVLALGEDVDGNVRVGTYASGSIKLARDGFVSYGRDDGLSGGVVRQIGEDQGGRQYVVTDDLRVHRFNGSRFRAIRPNVPDPVDASRLWHTALQDHDGAWWITTGEGLFRFPRVGRIEELAVARPAKYTVVDGVPLDNARRTFQDSRGDLWLRTRVAFTLVRRDHLTGEFRAFSARDGLRTSLTVSAIAEDPIGQVWIGFREGGVARLRDGRFEHVTAAEGAPRGDVQAIHADHAGRVWVGTIGGGVGRIDHPGATRITVKTYTTSEGLSSNTARCFTEDEWGRIYVGTAKGINRLDPGTGHLRLYTTADGLPGNEVQSAHRDRTGRLWFGLSSAVATLTPKPDHRIRPLSVRISGLEIAGVSQGISDIGVTDVHLGATENPLRFAYFAPAFAPSASVRYQYRLEGADDDWRPPTSQRAVSYERLAPGNYRFVVVALLDGVHSDTSASVSFRILPPMWQRWWFICLVGVLLGSALWMLHGARLRRLLELERIRGRIATDLHDDIGSGLSQISILSEVAIKQLGVNGNAGQPLSRIAATSRELVDTMSDIVWAINPRFEQLSDLTQRMRRFATDMLGSRDIDFRLQVPTAADDTTLGPHLRREVYRIFKESVTNIVRHSGCTQTDIAFQLDRNEIILRVRDNGHGESSMHPGNGLASMRARATRLGGSLMVHSERGQGTTLTLTLPLTQHLR